MVSLQKQPWALPSHRFLVLDENRFAYTATERLRTERVVLGEPLAYIFGPSGVGKSHLVSRFVREFCSAFPKKNVIRVTASEFAAEFNEAASQKQIVEFQQRYRSADLFICEDIQALAGRSESQQQLLAVIDELSASKSRIVVTGSVPPSQIGTLAPRLANRLRGGLFARLELPGRDSRTNLLRHFAASEQVAAAPDVINLLADSRLRSPRDLLGALRQLDASARQRRKPIDADAVRRLTDECSDQEKPSLAFIVRVVAHDFGLRTADILSPSRRSKLVLPRQCAMYLARTLSGEPLRKIAQHFGRQSHGCILHACEQVTRFMENDGNLARQMTDLTDKLKAQVFQNGQ